jgi:tRNA(Arg) A34 adenosine deaminase TadA
MKTRYNIQAWTSSKGGMNLSVGVNSYTKSHPLQKFFAEKVGQPNKIYLHAEILAMIRGSIVNQDIPMHTLDVVRYDKRHQLIDAKPCPICIEAAIFFGIKKINYSTSKGMVYGKTPQELKEEYQRRKD